MKTKIITAGLLVVPALLLTLTTTVLGDDHGAAVINHGNGQESSSCHYMGLYFTDKTQAVLTPNGDARLTCHFSDLDKIDAIERNADFGCGLLIDGDVYTTYETSWARTPGGTAKLTCLFPAP